MLLLPLRLLTLVQEIFISLLLLLPCIRGTPISAELPPHVRSPTPLLSLLQVHGTRQCCYSSVKLIGYALTHFLYNCIVLMGFIPREIRVAFPGESQLRQNRAIQPTGHAGCFSVSIIHRTLTWTTGSLTCTHVNA